MKSFTLWITWLSLFETTSLISSSTSSFLFIFWIRTLITRAYYSFPLSMILITELVISLLTSPFEYASMFFWQAITDSSLNFKGLRSISVNVSRHLIHVSRSPVITPKLRRLRIIGEFISNCEINDRIRE